MRMETARVAAPRIWTPLQCSAFGTCLAHTMIPLDVTTRIRIWARLFLREREANVGGEGTTAWVAASIVAIEVVEDQSETGGPPTPTWLPTRTSRSTISPSNRLPTSSS